MKKITKHKVFLAIASLMFLALGCGSSSSSGTANQPISLKIWGTFETQDNMNYLIQAFQAKYPGVQITYTQKKVDTYESDLLNALASGNGPDIFAIHNDWLPAYQDKLVEAPVKYMNLKDYKNSFVDVAVTDFVKDNKIYAAPLSVDSLGLYYNKDILGSVRIATPAKTWDQLKSDVRKITLKNGFSIQRSGVALGTSANVNRSTDIVSLMMLQNHAVPYSDDYSRVTLDQSINQNGSAFFPASDALNYYSSFALPGSDVYTWNSQSNYSTDAFANGDVAYVYGYSYLRDTIQQKAPNLNYDVAPVPQPSLNQNLVNFANYWGFAVSKQTKNVNASWALISFMTQKDSLLAYYKHHNLPSSRKDIIAEQINDPDIGVFAAANLTAKSMYKRNPAKFEDVFAQMIDAVTLRGQSPDTALRNAAEQINLLNQRSSQQ